MDVAIVTGAGRGIGAAIARRLAGAGAAVGLVDLDLAPAAEVARELTAAGHVASAVQVDVARLTSLREAVETVADRHGEPTILVNNAGLTRAGMLHRLSDEEWDVVQDVVLRGTFNGFRAIAPWFRDAARRPRRVVSVASVAGTHGAVGGANYAAAKAGVIGLTLTMAREWAPFGVTVNAVAPGFIGTRLTSSRPGEAPEGAGFPDELRAELISRIPLGRAGTPDDVAAAVGFFCSADAGYVTGQVLEVHGGLSDLTPPAPGRSDPSPGRRSGAPPPDARGAVPSGSWSQTSASP